MDAVSGMAIANDQYRKKNDFIYSSKLPTMSWAQMLAEECLELSKECNKLMRVISSRDPNPIFYGARSTEEEVEEELVKELLDVLTCAQYLAKARDWDPARLQQFATDYAVYKVNRTHGKSGECPRLFTQAPAPEVPSEPPK